MSQPSNDDRHFQRGVVLGLTLAEILLLSIFVLLMLLAPRLIESERNLRLSEEKLREVQKEQLEAEKQLAALKPLIDKLHQGASEKFDINKEWVRLKEELAAAKQLLEDNRALLQAAEDRKKDDVSASSKQIAEQVAEDAKVGQRVRTQARLMFPNSPEERVVLDFTTAAQAGKQFLDKAGAARDALVSAMKCQSELTTCKAQTLNLSRHVGVLPPCWVDDAGKIQFIFDATLREDGIWLKNNHVPGREEEQANLPLGQFEFERGVEAPEFVSAGLRLLQISKERGCRFYVRVSDQTSASSKLRFKTLLINGVEGIFYKQLAR